MGGGPRTFAGGLNKWQWKRMHEKKARDKERRLLDHERQLYQSRLRSQIRSNIVASADVPTSSSLNSQPTHSPLSPEEQIKALADRFMKEGAEDLWNEDDGPVTSSVTMSATKEIVGEPINLRKFVADNPGRSIDVGNLSSFTKSRQYSSSVMGSGIQFKGGYRELVSMNSIGVMSVRCYSIGTQIQKEPERIASKRIKFARNESSESEDDASGKVERGSRNPVPERKGRYPRFAANKSDISVDSDMDEKKGRGKRMLSSAALGKDDRKGGHPRYAVNESDIFAAADDDDDDSDSDMDGKRGRRKRMLSSAALGKYERKTSKRIPLQFVEKEDDLSRHVEAIRKEFTSRRYKENIRTNFEEQKEESFLSSKRFDECDISPLTVKALTAAGYVQMTRVQEATLTACLEGMDVMVKARTGSGKSTAFLSLKPRRTRGC